MRLDDARKLVGRSCIIHPHYDPEHNRHEIEFVRESSSHPGKIVFNVSGIEGGLLEDYVWPETRPWKNVPTWVRRVRDQAVRKEMQTEDKLTSAQMALLNELNIAKMLKKAGIHTDYPTNKKEYPQRSGNLETPVKQKHKGLMGQPNNPHGTMADKPGRPSSEDTVHARPTSMKDPSGLENLGEPLSRGISDQNVGDDANMHPSSKKHKPTRSHGPTETPGANQSKTWTSFGNRYPGIKSM
jgi:hypothetical protein